MIVKECRSHSWKGHGGGCWAGSRLTALACCCRVAGEGEGEGRDVLRLVMAVDLAKGSRPHHVWGCRAGVRGRGRGEVVLGEWCGVFVCAWRVDHVVELVVIDGVHASAGCGARLRGAKLKA